MKVRGGIMFEKGGRAPSRGILAGTREKSEPKLETKFDRLFEEVIFHQTQVHSCIVLPCHSVRQCPFSTNVKDCVIMKVKFDHLRQ